MGKICFSYTADAGSVGYKKGKRVSQLVWRDFFETLVARREFTSEQVESLLEELIQGRCAEAEAAAMLLAWRMKGETPGEIAAAVRVLRRHMLRWDPGFAVLDTCGTGGDGAGTFNISTATALVAAGAGVKVVKHGNRSVSSQSGSADVLAALGVHIEGDVEHARTALERAGLAFCFAPKFHPALRHVAPIRKRLGVATVFNCLGPLVNPAGAQSQLLGVGRPELLDLLADALAQLGVERAIVVYSRDGLDEVSLADSTDVRVVEGARVTRMVWTASDFGLDGVARKEIQAANPQASAAIIESVLCGKESPALRVVLANAAAALLAAGLVQELREGVARARAAIAAGAAQSVLDALRELAKSRPV
ncbi:MAG: anthranilate phosphoribosyltransferase [Gemmataceae bacterium]|nr:anthranilate phosphoribosyltransferase [Gemmataceae bacterium]MCI0742425.1 anthranilate phosphoribosyltransferase [Gemmataceae bacterium]